MKNKYVIPLLVVTSFSTYAMENKHSNQLVPDWKDTREQLIATCKNNLSDRLKEYTKLYPVCDLWDMDKLITTGQTITKQDDETLKSYIYATRDEEGNTFFHYAAEKNYESTIDWFLSSGQNDGCLTVRVNGQTPFELCINKLLPNVSHDETFITARNIFDKMLAYIVDMPEEIIDTNRKERCLLSIIALKLAYVCKGSTFKVKRNLLQKLVPNALVPNALVSPRQELSLAYYYRQARDENGFTFAHALAGDPDKLAQLAKKKYVSFAKNNAGFSALDCARLNLEAYTEGGTIEMEVLKKLSDCVHILLSCAKNLEHDGTSDTEQEPSCDDHS